MNIFDPAVQTRLRITSGLVLLIYVTAHFINHALGLWSLEVMITAGENFKSFWRTLPATIVLYGALFIHTLLAFTLLYRHRSLKMPWRTIAQTILGFSIPLIMALHVFATRGANEIFGVNDGYAYILVATFVQNPSSGIQNAVGLVVVWAHGCLGLFGWMKSKLWFTQTVYNIFLVVSTMLPVLALLGFLSAGRQIFPMTLDPEWMEIYFASLNIEDFEFAKFVFFGTEKTQQAVAILITLVLAARIARSYITGSRQQVTVEYTHGATIKTGVGATLLEISRDNNIPHASICGGKGRCSTCRVRVLEGSKQNDPSENELKVLHRVDAHKDVRLACQFIPTGHVKIAVMFPPETILGDIRSTRPQSSGVEQTAAVMFADIRGFTRESEKKLPFDVVYLVNQFSESMGRAIEGSGGSIDKFLGDGLMAIFGIETSPEQGCRDALNASRSMLVSLEKLNQKLAGNLNQPLRIGIGIHVGPLVLGEMGYGNSRGLSAIGDVVNTASRLESATKEYNAIICLSEAVANYAGIKPDTDTHQTINLRGKTETISIYATNEISKLNLQ